MVYIFNTYLNKKKKLPLALSEIYGLGLQKSQQICDEVGIGRGITLDLLSIKKLEKMSRYMRRYYKIGPELRREIRPIMERYISIGSYRGFRYVRRLPVRGQRTHGNSRTARKFFLSYISNIKNISKKSNISKKKPKKR